MLKNLLNILASSICMAAPAFAAIEGLYETECLQEGGASAVQSALFRDGHLKNSRIIFEDATCKSPAFELSTHGPYVLAEGTNNLDYDMDSTTIRPLSTTIAEYFNLEELCGFNDWSVNRGKDVSGLVCGGTRVPNAGKTVYTLVQELDTPGGETPAIQFGLAEAGLSGTTSKNRPVKFNPIIYFPQ